MSDHFKSFPKWFLIVLITAGISLIPYWYDQTQRTATVDHRIKNLEAQKTEQQIVNIDKRLSRVEYQIVQQKESRERFFGVLDKMDENLGRLSEAVVQLKVEIKNMKNKE